MSQDRRLSIVGFIAAWLMGSLFSYFSLGIFKNFFFAVWQLVALVHLIQALYVTVFYYTVQGLMKGIILRRHWLLLLVVLMVFIFSLSIIWMVANFPSWFEIQFFLPLPDQAVWFFISAGLSTVWLAFILISVQRSGYEARLLSSTRFSVFLENLPGLVLALAFLAAYFALAFTYSPLLVDPSENYDDNFYDADPTSWMNRFAGSFENLIEMRPVHPFGFLIFRPLTWLVALFLNGNRFYAALFLNSAAGALCVFLFWMFVRRWSNHSYAALISALLGTTASHLIFSTYLETYIFSAAALIGFLLLVNRTDRSLRWLIPAGLLTFGITISNFIQTLILLLFSELNLKKFARYILGVLVLGLVLAWLQFIIYPTSQPFYDPAQMLRENRYSASIEKPEQSAGRAYVVGRTILLHSVVAPRPLALMEEVGCIFPCFKTYKPRYGADLITSYAGFGSWLARSWAIIFLLAGVIFVRQFWQSPTNVSLQFALLICLLFNFILHWVYGDDPMLYSPNWTYALISFVALSFKDLAGRRWLQVAGLTFLIALMANNWQFLYSILLVVDPYL